MILFVLFQYAAEVGGAVADSPLVAVASWAVTGGVGGFAIFLWRRMETLYQRASDEHEKRLAGIEEEHENYRVRSEADTVRNDQVIADLRARLRSTEQALREAERHAHECELRNLSLEAKVDVLTTELHQMRTELEP